MAYVAALVAAVGVAAAVGLARGHFGEATVGAVVVWAAVCAAANLLAAPADSNVYLSMGTAVNVAIASLFEPPVAALIVTSGAVSEWELRRQTTVLHAIFNRAQLGCATLLTAAIFALPGDGPTRVAITLLGVIAYQGSNLVLVALAERTTRRSGVVAAMRRLLPRAPAALISFLVLGVMGVQFARAYEALGAWPLAVLMVPLAGARYSIQTAKQLERTERERRELADRLVDERERERTRLASDVHDVVLQQLAAIQINADNVVSALRAENPGAATAAAEAVRAGVPTVITDLRAVIADLRRTSLDGGLGASIERFAGTFHAETGVAVTVEVDPVAAQLPLPVALLLYECCQEGLVNVARHASATNASVTVGSTGRTIDLRVRDDGTAPPRTDDRVGFGLSLMRDKVALVGGTVSAGPRPGNGFELAITLPRAAT